MPTVPTHAIIGIALAPVFLRPTDTYGWALAGAGLAMLPDLDVLAFSLGIPYGSPFGPRGRHPHLVVLSFPLGIPYGSPCGHRGITHSLFFAAALSGLVAAATRQVGLQMSV